MQNLDGSVLRTHDNEFQEINGFDWEIIDENTVIQTVKNKYG